MALSSVTGGRDLAPSEDYAFALLVAQSGTPCQMIKNYESSGKYFS